ncbi:hypothetical protein FRC07_011457, partial [Ceratobasidium sp. 392]
MSDISSLPKLERLGICTGYQLDAGVIEVKSAPNQFPMLRHLELYNLQGEDLASIWRTESVIQALESLHLVIGPKPDPQEGANQWDDLLCWITPCIIAKLRQLTHLTLKLDFPDSKKLELIAEWELEDLSHLPLEYARICGLYLDPNIVKDEEIGHP